MESAETLSTEELTVHLRSLGLSEDDVQNLVREAAPAPLAVTSSVAEINEDDEEEMAFLVQCFPTIPRSTLKAKLIECKNDLDATTDLLLNYDVLKEETTPQFFDKRQKRLHKGQKRREKRASAVRAQDLDILTTSLKVSQPEAEKLYDMHGQSVSKVLQNHFNATAWDHRSISLLVEEVDRAQTKAGHNYRSAVSKTALSSAKTLRTRLEEEFEDEPITRQKVQDIKSQYIARMEALSEQAKAHSQRHETRQLAQEYRQEAADIMKRLKELQILEFHAKTYTQNAAAVDFHGMTVSVALAICDDRVTFWLSHPKTSRLELVTGAGNHSHGNIPRIKNAVRKYLDDRKIRYDENPGSFILY